MSQLSQISDNEIEDRYLVSGKTAIRFMLANYAKERVSFFVRLAGREDQFLTTLLGVDADAGRLYFDCSGSEEVNNKLPAAERLVFVGRPEGIHVQFSTGRPSATNYEGGRAFFVTLPDSLVRMQRRDSFRVETPRVRPAMFWGRLPDESLLNLPVHDLSITGVGLNCQELPAALAPDLLIANARISFPDEAQDLFVAVRVRRLTELEVRGVHQWRIGMSFVDLRAAEENRLQRYIVRIEHERRELS